MPTASIASHENRSLRSAFAAGSSQTRAPTSTNASIRPGLMQWASTVSSSCASSRLTSAMKRSRRSTRRPARSGASYGTKTGVVSFTCILPASGTRALLTSFWWWANSGQPGLKGQFAGQQKRARTARSTQP
eukprot:scaffold27254_cov70-Phaeocystis_antarctica.AAC.9